jgi:hypothetical protein
LRTTCYVIRSVKPYVSEILLLWHTIPSSIL